MAAELKKFKDISYCKFCKKEGIKNRIVWMTKYKPAYAFRDWHRHYSCEAHKHLIEDTDPNRTRAASSKAAQDDDGDMTEADYQTWWRL